MSLFDQFAQEFISRFNHPGVARRQLGVEKELMVMNASGKMLDVKDALWPQIMKQCGESCRFEYDQKYKALPSSFSFEEGILTTDAGVGVLEVILPPLDSVWKADESMKKMMGRLMDASDLCGLGDTDRARFVALGFNPVEIPSADAWSKKQRYDVLLESFDEELWPSALSAADQVHVDASIEEFVPMLNGLLGVAGFFSILFSNSPIRENKVSVPQNYRELLWDELGKDRTGIPERPYTSVEDFLDQLWSRDCLLAKRDGLYYAPLRPFRDVVKEGEKRGASEEELRDLFLIHEASNWQSVRPRFFGTLEIRPACLQSWDSMSSLPAFGLGLSENLNELEAFVAQFEWSFLRELRYLAANEGFRVRVPVGATGGGEPVARFMKDLLGIAERGLIGRGLGEEVFLKPLWTRVEEQKSLADKGIELFKSGGAEALVDVRTLRRGQLSGNLRSL
jgi:gamma-glutamylcysteine synthetase